MNAGDSIHFGRFRQGDRGRDRDIKAIEWLVLDVRDGQALLIAKQGSMSSGFIKAAEASPGRRARSGRAF